MVDRQYTLMVKNMDYGRLQTVSSHICQCHLPLLTFTKITCCKLRHNNTADSVHVLEQKVLLYECALSPPPV